MLVEATLCSLLIYLLSRIDLDATPSFATTFRRWFHAD